MLKFIRGKGHHVTAERLKLQKELFSFNRSVSHGFPHHPSALAYDPKLHLLAIGTKTGLIRVYGEPGVELYGQHPNDPCILQLFFLPSKGRLLSLCDDNTLHLWEINPKDHNNFVLENVKVCNLEGRLRKISTCLLHSSGDHLFMGTEGGNIYLLDVNSFEMTDNIIYQDVVMQNVPDDYKVNPGAVEAIAEHPNNPDKILIGYNRGLMVLWDNKEINAEYTYIGTQQLECLTWYRSGTQFMSAHNDGSYVVWNTDDPTKPASAPSAPYGPFPCKFIRKILYKSAKAQDDYIIFSGGMPRASYGDRNTITVMQGEKHEVLDLTSKIIDFFTISESHEDSEFDNPHALVVLVEEELLVIDLESEDWLPFKQPYLASPHSSAILCSHHCTGVSDAIYDKIAEMGQQARKGKYSDREWPVTGGIAKNTKSASHDLILTGHEDGSVRFWDVSDISMSHMYTFHTSRLYISEESGAPPAEEGEEWPPFRKVGTFDPYSEDPRLGIKKIELCIYSGTLAIAGTAGQILVLEIKDEATESEVTPLTVNIVGEREGFAWKGHPHLPTKKEVIKYEPGYQPKCIIQLSQPGAITALAIHASWGLVAVGSCHGMAVVDYVQNKSVTSKCTLNPNDLAASGDAGINRRKSFKKSLRESFRRLRKGRSQRRTRDKTPTRSTEDIKSPPATKETTATTTEVEVEAKPVERQVEFRSKDNFMSSMVRCLYFAQSYIVNTITTIPTLWAGTNAGAIYVYTLTVPSGEKRSTTAVTCQIGKEIQLKHRAPVIAIDIVDSTGTPLPRPLEVENNKAKLPELSGYHRVLICSEEQFKVFTLPSLKPFCKYKLTAHEGARVRKVEVSKFKSKSDESYNEFCLTCLTNQGDLSIYTIPDLRRQLVHTCCKKEDINGISSLVFTKAGQGFYLHSPCEFERFSLSAKNLTQVSCIVELPEGARPPPPPSPVPTKEEEPIIKDEETTIIEEEETPVNQEKEEGEVTTTIADETTENKVDSCLDDSKNMDVTIDSVKDHLANVTLSEETTVEKDESITKVTTITTKEVVINSTAEHIETTTLVNNNQETVPVAIAQQNNKTAPTAHIEEFNHIDEDT